MCWGMVKPMVVFLVLGVCCRLAGDRSRMMVGPEGGGRLTNGGAHPGLGSPRLLALLNCPQVGVAAAAGQQSIVGALLDDGAVLQHDDSVRIDNGGQSMGDHQAGVLTRHLANGLENTLLRAAVEGR